MSFRSFFHRSQTQRKVRRANHRHAGRRPRIEKLDDRCLLSLTPAVSYAVGTDPQAVVAADFNHDGRLDLATANYSSSNVSVLLGNANGTFQSAQYFDTGAGPKSIAVGDFNDDGTLDIATANASDVSVLRGNGNGTFGSPSNISIGTSPESVAVGDFNGDGKLDLGVTSNVYFPAYGWYYYGYYGYYEGQATVLLGNGSGSFSEPNPTTLGYGFHMSASAADFDGDGNDDFAAVNADYGAVSVLLGASTGAPLGAPASFATGWYTRAVTVGDFTGDGILDLATAGQTVDILPGFGDGTFQPLVRQSVDPFALAAADFNADGNLDLVTASYGNTVGVLLGTGDGALLTPIDIMTGAMGAAGVAVGDFNGDGRPDVASANSGSGSVSVFLNNGIWPAADAPLISVSDAAVTEGNTGTTALTFTVSLSHTYAQAVSVGFATVDGSATVAGGDYQAKSGTLTFSPGEMSKSITVLANGDRTVEPAEMLYLQLSNPTNAYLDDATGVGTINDDEPRISINNVTKSEGKGNKTTLFTFTVTLSAAYDQPVTMSYQTVNGTATTANNDYIAKSGTLTFAPGETTKTITIEVKADNKSEVNETFYLDLFGNSANSLFSKSRGIGTILNDDRR